MLIHGDAALPGQGVNMELLNMSQARGFAVGGTIHIVDQQPDRLHHLQSARRALDACTAPMSPRWSTRRYSTSTATIRKRWCSSRGWRSTFGSQFKRDVVIDLVCYRRHGHNEADEPAATQPLMYQIIRARPTARELYAQRNWSKKASSATATRGDDR